MTISYQIRECRNCGLRYPITQGYSFGTRCPSCLGNTRVVLTRPLSAETVSPLNELKPGPTPYKGGELSGLLDNVRSAWNVGSIFRTADGFGLNHLHLCGITPTPESEAVKKTSLGAEETISWTYHKNAVLAAQTLKSEGYRLFALEEDRSISIQRAKQKIEDEKIVLVAGNEITGVDPDLLSLCDQVFFIPMRGDKRSFNVAVAFAVAVSQIVL
jgi:23S rRNA (guanosine2251-2'-O)-methyltransferase